MVATASPSEHLRAVSAVGFIGLGDMGGAIARRIIDAGRPTVLWARRAESLEPFADASNVTVAATPADLAAAVDLICVCVWSDADVRDVLERHDGVIAGARPGTVVAVHSTVHPETARGLDANARKRGVVLVDAPVSGGRDLALAGSLVVAVGGDEPDVDRARPVFELFGDPVLHVGPVGTASLVKLVNNTMLAAHIAVADDALSLGAAAGIEPEQLAAVLRSGSGRSYGLEVAVMCRADAETRRMALPAIAKDVGTLLEHASTTGLDRASPLAAAASEAVRRLGQDAEGTT
jgi:3-hydroxyisobutyrate dehydrogenase-like beta-hydroxyacid dehydrogenase